MFATSCSSEDDFAADVDGAAVVSFDISTPEIASRAYSDGLTANNLQYAVYSVGANNALTLLPDLGGTTTINLRTTVELQLTTGNKYAVIFWADAANSPYTVDFATQTMTVDYTGAKSNDESRDAFYQYHEFTVTGAKTEKVKLYRPFAQLNIGSNDFEASATAGYKVTQSSVTVPVYNSMNLVDGTVANQQSVTFDWENIPTGETFPVTGYDYLSMNYLLVSTAKELVDMEFAYTDGANPKSRKVTSVPVQRNFRTNIYGQLFTGNVDIDVEIVPPFDGTLPGTLEEELIIAAQVGGTVTLTEDVVLTQPLVVSGSQSRAESTPVALEIDLNGKTISYTSDASAHSAMITINSGNKLVVKDSKGTGKIVYNYTGAGDPNFTWGTYTINNKGGNLVVDNGTIEIVSNLNAGTVSHMFCSIYQYSGSTTINGGNITNSSYRSVRLWKGDMTINGGVFEGQVWVQAVDNSSVMTINGGSFSPSGVDSSSAFITNDTYDVALKVTDGTFETKLGCSNYTKNGVKGSVSGGVFGVAPDANLLAAGLHAVEQDGKYYIVSEEIDNVVTNAEELKEVIANGSGNIALTQDITVDVNGKFASVAKDNNVTINLNGNDIIATTTASSASQILFEVKGELTIEGEGTIALHDESGAAFSNAYENAAIYVNGGVANLKSGLIECTSVGEAMAYAADAVGGNSVINIDGATLYSSYIGVRSFPTASGKTNTINYNSGIVYGAKNGYDIWTQEGNGASVVNIAADINYTFVDEFGGMYYIENDGPFGNN